MLKVRITNTKGYLSSRFGRDIIVCLNPNKDVSFIVGGGNEITELYDWEIDVATRDSSVTFFLLKDDVSVEIFLENIREANKETYLWLLFHPEIFRGKYTEDGNEIKD